MVSRDAVHAAYKWILGRTPESEAAIEHHMNAYDEGSLRRSMLACDEFSALFRQIDHESWFRTERETALPAPAPVAWQAEGEVRDALFRRVSAAWESFGERFAHWSVLTFDAFMPERLEENRAAFFESAEIDLDLMRSALSRFPELDPAELDCLEVGCGVGRATRGLAGLFRHVIGVDVSAPHLAIAGSELAEAGISTVTLSQIRSVEDYSALPEADVFYSRIVLQHNPPPVQAEMLGRVFGRLRPGGIAVFQVVTHIEGYSYDPTEDATAEGAMEMHALPQPAVFECMRLAGVEPVEVQQNTATTADPRMRSHTFVGRKAG